MTKMFVKFVVLVSLAMWSCGKSDGKPQGGAGDSTGAAVAPDDTGSASVAPKIEMVFVEGGTFTMGCTPEHGDNCDSDERPTHSVTVGGFSIGKYEVTQKQWVQVMGSNPSYFKGNNLPVESVSWNDVQEFVAKLNTMSGKTYRLPTEAEWEYAARGGSKSKGFKYSGSNNIDKVAWYSENSGRQTKPAGTKQTNELGIHDMSGNVWEWVNDWYGSYDPTGPASGSYRVDRGGSWFSGAIGSRVSFRGLVAPDDRSGDLGFRLALSP